MEHFKASLKLHRDIIHKAVGDMPAIKHVPLLGRTVPRIQALQHVLYLLDQVESTLADFIRLEEKEQAATRMQADIVLLAAFGMIDGILWDQGIDLESLPPGSIVDKKA